MCGRFTLHHSTDEVAERFGVQEVLFALPERYNIAPQQPVAVVTQDDGGDAPGAPPRRTLDAFRWGLIPFWARDPAIGGRMINARAETLLEKPAFKNALSRRRCLIPADGFFEWAKRGNGRQPMRIRQRDERLFALAGLWEEWSDPERADEEGGPPLRTCTIITVAPNGVVAPIHDRMPAILRPSDEALWLDPSVRDGREVIGLLGPYEDEAALEAYPVSRRVNTPGNDDPECITRLADTAPGGAGGA